jgi:plasmid rolling circle replication initiator protein Rep
MEITEEYIERIKKKKDSAINNARLMYALSIKYKDSNKYLSEIMRARAERMENCLCYWKWDLYRENKVMNLKVVSRCKDMFCPNCRTVGIYKAIKNFTPYFGQMMMRGFMPCLMTLTVPNIKRGFLSEEITNMNKAFGKLWRWLYKPFKKNGKYGGGYKDRLFDAVGAVKAIEVTVQKSDLDYFNLHYHVIIFIDGYIEGPFYKHIPGGFHYKTNSLLYYSDADIFIQKLWTMAYKDRKIKEFGDASDNWKDNYICDIRELVMPKGLFEVFKYCFKDFDIKNLDIFEDLYFGLKRKRLRQGYGELFNVKLEDNGSDDCIENYLEFKDESPETLIYQYIEEMTGNYGEYKKLSLRKTKYL